MEGAEEAERALLLARELQGDRAGGARSGVGLELGVEKVDDDGERFLPRLAELGVGGASQEEKKKMMIMTSVTIRRL